MPKFKWAVDRKMYEEEMALKGEPLDVPEEVYQMVRKSCGDIEDIGTRIAAAYMYAMTGDMNLVQEEMGLTRTTLYKYMQAKWWKRACESARDQQMQNLGNRWQRMLTRVTEEIEDRVENGETRIVNGEERKVPLPAKDLMLIIDKIFDKKSLVEGKPTSITQTSSEDELKNIMSKLESIGDQKVIDQKVTIINDIEDTK